MKVYQVIPGTIRCVPTELSAAEWGKATTDASGPILCIAVDGKRYFLNEDGAYQDALIQLNLENIRLKDEVAKLKGG